MAAELVAESIAATLETTRNKETPQIVVAAIDPSQNVKDEATSDNKLANLISRIEELERSIEGLKKKDADQAKEKDVEEQAGDEIKSQTMLGHFANEYGDPLETEKKEPKEDAKEMIVPETPFGSLAKVCLELFNPMKDSSGIVKRSTKLKSCAITAFYDVPSSAVNNMEAWEEGTQTPGYLPSRVSINSMRLIELLKTITDTIMNNAPCVMIPPFKLFAVYWTDIAVKLKQLQDDFAMKYNRQWDAELKDDTAKLKPLIKEDVEEDANREEDLQDVQHLHCLVGFMNKYLHEIPDLRERIKSKQIESISFDDLWYLFNPGDIILGRTPWGKSEQQAYQVLSVTKGRIRITDNRFERPKDKGERQRNDLRLQCISLDYDGTKVDIREEVLFIKVFVNKKKIVDLDYYPKSFATDENVEALKKRAYLFLDNRYGHGRCDGITARFEIEHIDNEEVFVDFKSGYEELPADWKSQIHISGVINPPDCQSDETYEIDCALPGCASCNNSVYLDEQVDIMRAEAAREKLPKSVPESKIETLRSKTEWLLLLPWQLLVYTLRTKKWHFVNVRDFEKIVLTPEKIKEGWKNLVIEPKNKRLLKALVSDHATAMVVDKNVSLPRSGIAIDIVRGKGRGRIVFLYGPPGVGKTSTAETIAAFTSPPRPLYPVTCGDLGSDPIAIQEALEGHFKLAHRWNCVLLLDEADVYLAERHHTDLDRNGIVSVFLRTLEYYSGILFLTSNRVGSIDPAFKSRIHMALRYKKIDFNGTCEIWTNILHGIGKDNKDSRVKVEIDYDPDDLLTWAKDHFVRMEEDEMPTWNGRQIRNAFQSAIALASYDRMEMLRKRNITEEQAMRSKNPNFKKIRLLERHFEDVSKIVHEFDEYLIECGKGDDKAEKEGLLAPEIGGIHTQAYRRGANKTTRATEQKTTTQAKAKPPAAQPRRPPPGARAPASSSRDAMSRKVIKSKPVVMTRDNYNEDSEEDGDVDGRDNGNAVTEDDDDFDVDDIDMEENGVKLDGDNGNDIEDLDVDAVVGYEDGNEDDVGDF